VDLFEADAGSSMISFKFGPLFQDRSAFSDIKRSRISAVLQSSVSGKPTRGEPNPENEFCDTVRRKRRRVPFSNCIRRIGSRTPSSVGGSTMGNVELTEMQRQIRSMKFERGTPDQIALWRDDLAEARANLVIEGLAPTSDDDEMFAMMLEEGVPPRLMPTLILQLYRQDGRG